MKKSIENLYQLDGRVPLGKALPFGLQHVLAIFVSNLVRMFTSARRLLKEEEEAAVREAVEAVRRKKQQESEESFSGGNEQEAVRGNQVQ